MKAQHRKELHTNALADSLGRFYDEIRARPQSVSIIIWVIGVLAVVLFVIWFFTQGAASSRSALWVQLEGDSYTKSPQEALSSYEQIAKDSPKTIPGRTARFQEARYILPHGLEQLGATDRPEAIKNLLRARELFNQLSTETKDDPLLRQEALLGAAKAEEALLGVANADKPDQVYGNLDKALDLYRQAAQAQPESYLGKQAQAHVKQLEDNRPAVEKFYAELNKLAKTAAPAPPPFQIQK